MDGGVGTELERRGYPMHPACWSACAGIEAPDLLLQVHRDFIDAGADIVSANTFMAAPHIVAAAGVDDCERINRVSVELAMRARDECGRRDIIVAGTLSPLPPLNRADRFPRGAAVERSYREQARLLADAGVDVLLAEMLIDTPGTATLLEACVATGLPVWAGASACRLDGDGRLMAFRQPGTLGREMHETFESVLSTIQSFPVQVVGVMHTSLALMPSALSTLDEHWPGRRLAYAKLGEAAAFNWRFGEADDPVDYAVRAGNWIREYGVGIVGGCCGTGPAHVRALRDWIDGR